MSNQWKLSALIRSNVLGLIAIFIALGGTATALRGRNTVDSGDIKKGNVKRSDLAPNAVNGTKIADDTLTGADVVESSLNLSGISPGGTAGGDLSGSYPNPDVAAHAIGSPEIADGAVGPSEIADNAVGSPEIADNAVGPSEIADQAVGSGEIADGSLRIADQGITPAASAFASANLPIGTGSTTSVPLDAENFDTASMHQTSGGDTSKLVAPVAGIYRVSGAVRWASDSTGDRFLGIKTPGGPVFDVSDWRNANATNGGYTDQNVTTLAEMNANESAEMYVYQSSGGDLDLISDSSAAPTLSMEWVGPATVGTP